MTLAEYLELLAWTGLQMVEGKRGAIPESMSPILTRLGFASPVWLWSWQRASVATTTVWQAVARLCNASGLSTISVVVTHGCWILDNAHQGSG